MLSLVTTSRSIWSIAFLAVFAAWPISATIIIAIRTSTSVVIGADSKLMTGDGRDLGADCKIRIITDAVYALAGLSADTKTGFSVDDLTAAALKEKGTLTERVASLEARVTPKLQEILTAIKAEIAPLEFQSRWIEAAPLEIIFASIENNEPRVIIEAFTATIRTDGAVVVVPKRKVCPGICEAGTPFGVFLGVHDLIDREAAANPTILSQLGIENAVRHFLEEEILDQPSLTARPISLVRISKGGVSWVEPGVCGNH